MTSHDVVAKVRRTLGLRRVGHAGTLDPLATGVLVVCVGRATRLSEYVMASTKTYAAQVYLGAATTTYDAEGDITAQHDASHITRDNVAAVLPQFTGHIDQLPPMYSAIKQDGKKLYEIARSGESVEVKARQVRIDRIDITAWNPPTAMLDIQCGSGTYIRSLAHDIGAALDVGAHLSGLRRTKSGQFNITESVPLAEFIDHPQPASLLTPPRDALADYPHIVLTSEELNEIRHGRRIDKSPAFDGELAMAYTATGDFVAVLEAHRNLWKPHKVFLS